jgi:hypothetical protein
VNSKVKTLNLRAASLLAALSLSLTGYASLAQSNATSSASTQARSNAGTQAQSSASTQAQSNASSQASYPAASQKTATTTGIKPAAGPATPATQVAKAPDLVALQGPTLITQKGTGWKTASTFIDLKDGQQFLPLTFTLTNGANNQQKMQGVRIKLNGHEIFTEKAFKGKEAVSLSLSDVLAAGQTQMIVETFGPPGATLSWVLTTLKIKVSDIKPVNCKIGETVKISGKNFPLDKLAYRLTVDQTTAKITKATATSVEFTVPDGLQGGKRTVTLWIAGVKCDPLYIKIAAAPEVTAASLLGGAPGNPISIQGKGFSTTAGENQVLLKTPEGQIIATVTPTVATETELTITIPMDYPCPADILCTVKTNGQESAKGVVFSVGQRVIDKGLLQ